MENKNSKSSNFSLIFFDTFSHDNLTEATLDVIRFRQPVEIQEIRVIPLGAKVEADFPGGVRLGATNPSSFDINFFVNDLKQTELCTFSEFGKFDYKQNVNIQYLPEKPVCTDCLLLKGKFITLTLAVFGVPVDASDIFSSQSKSTLNESALLKEEPNLLIKQPFPDPEEPDEPLQRLESKQTDDSKEEFELETEPNNQPTYMNEFERIKKSHIKQVSEVEEFDELDDKDIKSVDLDADSFTFETVETKHSRQSSSSEIKSKLSLPNDNHARNEISSPVSEGPLSNVHSPDQSFDDHLDEDVQHDFDNKNSKSHAVEVTEEQVELEFKKTISVNYNESMDLEAISPEPVLELTEAVSDIDDDFDQTCTTPTHLESNQTSNEKSTKKDALETISSSEEEYFEEPTEDTLEESREEFIFDQDTDLEEINFINHFKPDFDYLIDSLEFDLNQVQKNKSKQIHLLHNINLHNQKASFDERWIEFVEQLSKDLHQLNPEDSEIVLILIEWIKIGLDFEKATNQKQTAYKVRHLKAGVRLIISMIKQNPSIADQLIENNCLHLLFDLFNKPYMSLPVKLLLVRALDAFADCPSTAAFIIQPPSITNSEQTSIYQQLIELLAECNQTRLTVAISTLINKLHLFEIIATMPELIQHEPENVPLLLSELQCLFNKNSSAIAQRLRYLPSSIMFTIPPAYNDSKHCIFQWLQHYNTWSLLLDTLEHTNDLAIFSELIALIEVLIDHEQGLRFLLQSTQIEQTNRLRKLLLTDSFCLKFSSQLESSDLQTKLNNKFKQIVNSLTYRAYVFQLLHKIEQIQSDFQANKRDMFDNSDLCDLYNRLFSLLFDEQGQKALVVCFCSTDRLNVILSLLIQTLEQSTSQANVLKLAVVHYASRLLLYTLSRADERLPLLFERFEQPLLALAYHSRVTVMTGFSRWIAPLKRGFTYNQLDRNVRVLIQILKEHYEQAVSSSKILFQPQADLVAAVHLLNNLCVDANTVQSDAISSSLQFIIKQTQSNLTTELKYRYALIETFSQNGFAYILTICKRLAETFLKPAPRHSLLYTRFGRYMFSLFLPCIQIIKQTLFYLTACRSNQFQDITPVTTLFLIYCTAAQVSKSCYEYERANQIGSSIIDCLRIYTQIDQNSDEIENQVFAKSVWTKMIQELITLTLSRPQFFAPGLDLLSRLLPLPLPVDCFVENSQEAARMVNFRKLWSAHLHSISNSIEQLITQLASSSSSSIRVLVSRLCVQLSDLSSHTALVVARCLYSLLKLYFTSSSLSSTSPSSTSAAIISKTNSLHDICDDLKASTDSVKDASNQINHRFSFFLRLPDRSLIGTDSQLRLIEFISCLLNHKAFNFAFQIAFKTQMARKDNSEKQTMTDDWTNLLVDLIRKQANASENKLFWIIENRSQEEDHLIAINGDQQQVICYSSDQLNAYFHSRPVQKVIDSTNAQLIKLIRPCTFDCCLLDSELKSNLSLLDSTQFTNLDLNDLAVSCLPADYNVSERLRQLWTDEYLNSNDLVDLSPPPTSRVVQRRSYAPLITRENSSKQPYVAPMRGRGFQRNVLMNSRYNDPFRSRPPNTSRPPSMHVDDFVALEAQNNKRGLANTSNQGNGGSIMNNNSNNMNKYSNMKMLNNNSSLSSSSANQTLNNSNLNRLSSVSSNRMYQNHTRHSSYVSYNSFNNRSNINNANSNTSVYGSQLNDQPSSSTSSSIGGNRSSLYNRYNSNHYSNNQSNSSNYRNNTNWNSNNTSNSFNNHLSNNNSNNRSENRNNRGNF